LIRRLLSAPLAWVVVERPLPSAEALNTSAHSLYDLFDVEWFAKLRVEESGRRVPTHAGARNGVVASDGRVYLAHGSGSDLNDLVVVTPAK
jgi:hypothetical protein